MRTASSIAANADTAPKMIKRKPILLATYLAVSECVSGIKLFSDRNRVADDVVCLVFLVHVACWVDVCDEVTSIIELE